MGNYVNDNYSGNGYPGNENPQNGYYGNGQPQYMAYKVQIYDEGTRTYKSLDWEVDVTTFPPEKYSYFGSYYAIRRVINGKPDLQILPKNEWSQYIASKGEVKAGDVSAKKGSGGKKVLSILLAIFLVIGGIAVRVFLTDYFNDKKEEETYSDSSSSYSYDYTTPEIDIPEPEIPDIDIPAPGSKVLEEQEPPANGTAGFSVSHSYPSQLKVNHVGSDDNYYFIKLVDPTTNLDVQTVFLHPHQSATVNVTPGSYKVRWTKGTTWYGYEDYFGYAATYNETDEPYDFDSGMVQIFDIGVTNGNVSADKTTKTDF